MERPTKVRTERAHDNPAAQQTAGPTSTEVHVDNRTEAVLQNRHNEAIDSSPRAATQFKQIHGIHNSPRTAAQRKQIQNTFGDAAQLIRMNPPIQLKKISEAGEGELVVGTEYKVKKDGAEWQYATYKGMEEEIVLGKPPKFVQSHSVQFLHALSATTLKGTDEFLPTDRSKEVIEAEKEPKSYAQVVAKVKSEWDSIKGGFDFGKAFPGPAYTTGFWGQGKENARLTADAESNLTESNIAASIGLDTDKLKVVVGGSRGAQGAMHILIQRKSPSPGDKSYLNFHMLNPVV